jgi:predicted nucleotidyltransferase
MKEYSNLAKLKHLADQERVALLEFISRLRERCGDALISVRLFGSKVRGDFDEESDLDVLVIIESEHWHLHREVSFIGSRVSLDYDVNISPKAIDHALYLKLRELHTPFYENVQAEGVEI